VIQEPDDSLTVLLAGSTNSVSDTDVVNRLIEGLVEQGVSVPKIEISHVTGIPKTTSGKAPLIKAYRGLPLTQVSTLNTPATSDSETSTL
jgi:hypothetical protein